jgi:hypothetical protein
MLNERIWNSLKTNGLLQQIAPLWVRSVLETSFADIQQLPLSTDAPTVDIVFRPTLEFDEITTSYLDFLRTQIKLEPRGKEWAAILKARLDALVPYEHKKLYRMSILRMHERQVESFFVRFRPDDFRIVHSECS